MNKIAKNTVSDLGFEAELFKTADKLRGNLEPSEYINSYQQEAQIKNSLDSIYDEIQTPLLISILYFLFQLPIMKKTLFKYIPYLCHSDGNYNLKKAKKLFFYKI